MQDFIAAREVRERPFRSRSAVLLTALLLAVATASGAQTPSFSTGGIDAGSTADTLNAAVSRCTSSPGWVLVTQPVEIPGPLTVPASCILSFQAGGELRGAGSVAISGEIIAAQSQQIFRSPLRVSGLSAATSASGSVPVEWFGASFSSFRNCAAAPDSTDGIQSAINAISSSGSVRLGPGCYHTSRALAITRRMVGIKGSGQGFSAPGITGVSTLLSTSSTADILDVTGTPDNYLLWNNLEDFAVERDVTPEGNAAGIAVNYAGGLRVSRVWSHDSIRDIYLHGVPDYGIGVWREVSVGWGFAHVHLQTGQLYGWYFDSSDGVAMNSFKGEHLSCAGPVKNGPTIFCYYLTGSAINDVDLDSANVAAAAYGLYVNYTGSGSQDSAADIHINMPTMDDCRITCIYVKGLPANGDASLSVHAGYLDSNTPGTKIVDIEDSYGVAITDNQIFAIEGSSGNTGIYAANSASLSLQQNKFQSLAAGTAIAMIHTVGSAVTGNTLLGTPKLRMTTGISLSDGSKGNALFGNVALGNFDTAYRFDGASKENDFAANSCAPSDIEHCVAGKVKGTAPHTAEP